MRNLFLASTLVLAACGQQSQPPTDNGSASETAEVAPTAKGTPATPEAERAPLNPPAPGEPGGLDNDTTPIE